ncbi:MAG: DUF3303 family protein [Thermoplasmata archaeon]
MAPFLLQILSAPNAEKAGLKLHGDAVARGQHHLYVILEGPNEAAVRQYLGPFAQAGSLDVTLASSCEEVVGRGACGAPTLHPGAARPRRPGGRSGPQSGVGGG